MANLIIKSSADNLVLQGSDASPAVTVGATGTLTFAENVTMSGTANNVGTVTAGTLGPAVAFNDAHKDIDCDADSWMRFVTTTATASSNANMVFDGVGKMGSNITYDGTSDYIQVAKAGWYLITLQYSHSDKADQVVDVRLRKSQSTGATPSGDAFLPRLYQQTCNDGTGFWDAQRSGFTYLAATDRVDVYGTYATYGTSTLTSAMTMFTGIRLGA